jgi:hypothetical protein
MKIIVVIINTEIVCVAVVLLLLLPPTMILASFAAKFFMTWLYTAYDTAKFFDQDTAICEFAHPKNGNHAFSAPRLLSPPIVALDLPIYGWVPSTYPRAGWNALLLTRGQVECVKIWVEG